MIAGADDDPTAGANEPTVKVSTATSGQATGGPARRGGLLAKDTQWGKWTIKSHLDSGGSAQVWRANDDLGNVAAIKFLVNLTSVARFHRELDLARLHDGRWAPGVLDADLDDTLPWIAFEYLDRHKDLASVIQSQGPIRDQNACAFARDLWDAVLSLHQSGIVHRDLSARNVLVGPDGALRLVDLGLSKSDDAAETATQGSLGGSPGFASPEQVLGVASSHAADYWGWAAVVVFASSAHPVLPAANAEQYRYSIYEKKEVDLNGVPADLLPSLRAALRYGPTGRNEAEISGHLPLLPNEKELRAAKALIEELSRELEQARHTLGRERAEDAPRSESAVLIARLEIELDEALSDSREARQELDQSTLRRNYLPYPSDDHSRADDPTRSETAAPAGSSTRHLLLTLGAALLLALVFVMYLLLTK